MPRRAVFYPRGQGRDLYLDLHTLILLIGIHLLIPRDFVAECRVMSCVRVFASRRRALERRPRSREIDELCSAAPEPNEI